MFAIYMILVTLLLVNMLIAMMGNTYQLVNETQKEWFRQVRYHLSPLCVTPLSLAWLVTLHLFKMMATHGIYNLIKIAFSPLLMCHGMWDLTKPHYGWVICEWPFVMTFEVQWKRWLGGYKGSCFNRNT